VLIPTPRRILVARDPVDFRKGIAGLAAVCEVQLGEAPPADAAPNRPADADHVHHARSLGG